MPEYTPQPEYPRCEQCLQRVESGRLCLDCLFDCAAESAARRG